MGAAPAIENEWVGLSMKSSVSAAPSTRDARLANTALNTKKRGIDHLYPIVEIACAPSSPHHPIAVRHAYCSLYDCSLEEDIVPTLNLPLRKILVGYVSSYRYDKEAITGVANSEAGLLRAAVEKKQLDHDYVMWILSTRNVFQLRATFQCYKQRFGNPIEEDIKSCGKGDLENLLRVIIGCLDAPERHFAQVVRNSIVGFGTDEDTVTRAIVTRTEIDMMRVRGEYFNMYHYQRHLRRLQEFPRDTAGSESMKLTPF